MIIFIILCCYKNSILTFTAEFIVMVFQELSDLKNKIFFGYTETFIQRLRNIRDIFGLDCEIFNFMC